MLSAALSGLQSELQLAIFDAMNKGFKATFNHGVGDEGELLALKFATEVSNSLAPKLASAINNFVLQADITGSPLGLANAGGPVIGVVAPKTLVLV